MLVGPLGPFYIVLREVYRVGWPTWSSLYCTQRGLPCWLTHSRRALLKVFGIGFGQIEDILGIILVKEFFKKSN